MEQFLRPDSYTSGKHRAGSSASDDSSSSMSSNGSSLRSSSSCNPKTPPLTFTHIMGQGRVNQLGGVFINGRPLPHHIRLKIIEMAAKGIKPCSISRQLRVSHGCVSKILYRYAETGTVVPGQIGGASKQSRKMIENLEKEALEVHQQNPDISAAQIRAHLMSRGMCDRSTLPSTHSIAKLIRSQDRSKDSKKSLKHSISGILGETDDQNSVSSDDAGSPNNQNNSRRCRTWFSPEQLECLERSFNANTYPNSQQREQISIETGLNEAKIQVWFSNRRARYRKTVTSASIENWNTAIRGSQISDHLQIPNNSNMNTPSPQLPALSPALSSISGISPALSAISSSFSNLSPIMGNISENFFPQNNQRDEGEHQSSLFPQFPQISLLQHANQAQLLTSLMLFARPEYLQLLQQQKESN